MQSAERGGKRCEGYHAKRGVAGLLAMIGKEGITLALEEGGCEFLVGGAGEGGAEVLRRVDNVLLFPKHAVDRPRKLRRQLLPLRACTTRLSVPRTLRAGCLA